MKLIDLKDPAESTIKVAVYGQTGTGKTCWCAGSPSPLFLLTETQAIPSIKAINPEAKVILCESWQDFRTAFELVKFAKKTFIKTGKTHSKALSIQIPNSKEVTFQTLIIDSFTDLQNLMIDEMMKHKISSGFDLENTSKLTLQQWGRLQDVMRSILRDQRSLHCNVVVISLSKETYDDKDRRRVLPALTGKMIAPVFGQFFNAVAYMTTSGDGRNIMVWKPDARFISKPAPGFPSVTLTRTCSLKSLLSNDDKCIEAFESDQS